VEPKHLVVKISLGCVSLGESENGFVIPDHMDSSTPKKRKIPKKDYFVMTRQAGGTQYLCQNNIYLVLP